jgi:uncharacterized protein (TIGR03067 family)
MKFLAILLLLTFAAGCAALHSNSNRDSRLYGDWICVSGTIDGKPLPDATVQELRLAITQTRYITEKGNETLFNSTYRVDRTKSPARIFMLGNEGALTGKEAQGIYEISGETLRICYAMPGEAAPSTFDSKPGSKAHFVLWRPAKK